MAYDKDALFHLLLFILTHVMPFEVGRQGDSKAVIVRIMKA
jgi:hypothetical protein